MVNGTLLSLFTSRTSGWIQPMLIYDVYKAACLKTLSEEIVKVCLLCENCIDLYKLALHIHSREDVSFQVILSFFLCTAYRSKVS